MSLGFHFELVREDGPPADPPKLTALPNWSPGDTIHLPQEAPSE
jgi:hypothetical protein